MGEFPKLNLYMLHLHLLFYSKTKQKKLKLQLCVKFVSGKMSIKLLF